MSGRGGPGGNSRGRGGKFKKYTRGGGKHFSRDLRPLDADGNEISMWSQDAQKGSEQESEEESSEEESSEEEGDAGPSQQNAELTREERKQAKKAQKEAAIAKKKKTVQVGDLPTDSEEEEEDDDMPANPNHSKAARNMTKAPSASVDEATEGVKNLTMSRKERESLEAQQAKERYRKLHEAGKTDEAKADLARLRLIREKREAEAARKQAEKEEREAQEKARRAEIEAKEAKKREAALGKSAGKKKSTK
ncbi:casein kinase substrate phosphoprotein PP28-domain-containing protein [Daldinia eschscholtzii]|uniref:Casein kinase substrate phosphoprotein PP28 domain-containing protein n=1 Tax=Daldinia eschscholtzii TaxID=292717 RepID=A0AAX6MKE8_9PEZI|nr:casein kinase substrate phosphoprotein PP28-domain-containing protein [Daldinia eschscholtzii]